MSNNDAYLSFAIALAREAGCFLMQHFGKQHFEQEKESFHSIVTTCDIDVEQLIIKRIKEQFPCHSIVSEESGADSLNSEFQWIIDPIDGSSYFARGIASFSVAIALLRKGEIVLGVIDNPVFKETFYASNGGGAFRNEDRIAVSTTKTLNQSIFSFGHRFIRSDSYKAQASELLNAVRSIRAGGSCAQELCQLACGRIDGLIAVNQSSWDYFAGKIILEEAGGKMNQLNGKPILISDSILCKQDIYCSNGIL